MGTFTAESVMFIVYTMFGFVAILAGIMAVTGLVRLVIRKALDVRDPDPNSVTYASQRPHLA